MHKVLTRAWEHSMQRGAARCLIIALADIADEQGISYPGIAYLAGMINEDEDYTYKLLRKLIEAGEIVHKPGGGRGRKTLYAVIVGLSDAQKEKVNTALQSRVYHEKTPKNPAPQNSVLQNGVKKAEKPCTFPDSKQTSFTALEPTEPPIAESLIHDHDPIGGGGEYAREKEALNMPAPVSRHVPYLVSQGMEAAEEFSALDPDAAIQDFNNRRADNHPIGAIVKRWRKNPPHPGAVYERRTTPQNQQKRSAPAARAEPIDADAVRASVKLAKRDGW